MSTTRVTRRIHAPRERVYAALIDADAVARWKVPASMTCEVHAFDAREGGRLRISLTYEAPDAVGKTTAHTDTYHGRFERLVPHELVVEVDEFETSDPDLEGEMTITVSLSDAPTTPAAPTWSPCTKDVPRGVSPDDNALGWRESLDRLAALGGGDLTAQSPASRSSSAMARRRSTATTTPSTTKGPKATSSTSGPLVGVQRPQVGGDEQEVGHGPTILAARSTPVDATPCRRAMVALE